MLEGERGAVIAVEDYGGLERAPVLLGEALDRRRSSFDEQGFQLAVRQLLFRYRPKYGQAALRIFALGYFRVERHPAPAAGTRSACTPGDRPDLHLEQFGRDLRGVNFDTFTKGEGVHLPDSDLRKGQLPAARHGGVGDPHVLDDAVHGEALLGGHERLFFHV